MAKSIRINEIDAQRDQLVAPLTRGAFWEHWFEAQSHDQKPQVNGNLDEHSIWETAVNLEILATGDKKF
ncbi:MAG TPA: hypothetical protein VH280_05505 [Verrucomicrobiae bacterium]|jgi:hypothetical protein|nr:hypothetical protein [Verrucomicrobiae bacterium]